MRATRLMIMGSAVILALAGCAPSNSDAAPLNIPDASSGSGTGPPPSGSLSTGSSSTGAGHGTGTATGLAGTGSAGTGTRNGTGSAGGTSGPAASGPSGSGPSASGTGEIALAAAPAAPTVAGYTYSAPTAALATGFATLASHYAGVFSAPTVRTVTHENDSVGTVSFMALADAYVGNAGVENGVVQGLVQGMSDKGYVITTQAIAGHSVVLAAGKQGTIVAWYDRGLVAVVTTTNPPPRPLAFATIAVTH